MEKVELIQDIETGLHQIREGKGISHSEAHQRIKSRFIEEIETRENLGPLL